MTRIEIFEYVSNYSYNGKKKNVCLGRAVGKKSVVVSRHPGFMGIAA